MVLVVQAMQELSQCLAADMPGKADERSAQVHTQLMLLAQIAQQCSTARPS